MNLALPDSFSLFASSLAIGTTVLAYIAGIGIFIFFKRNLLFHPILVATLLVSILLFFSSLTLESYQLASSPLAMLLGPVTVALAVPLFNQIKLIFSAGWRSVLVILIGAIVAPVTAILWLFAFDFAASDLTTMLTKSITTPLAMETSRVIGGIPDLAAAIVIITGLVGVLFSRLSFKLAGCTEPQAQGLALGSIAHAIGTARALQLGPQTAAFATLALCINGVVTAIVLPLIFFLLG